jgi:pimeloyl-ACP methyl ester carboxylesterase
MQVQPETRYARSGDVSIAYQVLGEGLFDLVFIPPFLTHVELVWTLPSFAPFLTELASFSRLIRFDKRGTGMSDRVTGAPTLETRMDDVRAVMDAAGCSSTAPTTRWFRWTWPSTWPIASPEPASSRSLGVTWPPVVPQRRSRRRFSAF